MISKITYIKALGEELCGYWPGKKVVAQQYVLMGMEQPSVRDAMGPLKMHQLTWPARREGIKKGYLSGSYAAIAPVCGKCSNPCVTLRVNTEKFALSASQRLTMADQRYHYDLRPTSLLNPHELFNVFKKYTRERHAEKESGMGNWNLKRFKEWADFMPFMFTARASDGRLAGYAAVNAEHDFAVLEYLTYDPAFSKDSIGKRLWLQMMTEAQNSNIPHVYVGAWSKGSPKLDYKKNHSGLETIVDGKWVDFDPALHAGGTDYRGMLKSDGFHIA